MYLPQRRRRQSSTDVPQPHMQNHGPRPKRPNDKCQRSVGVPKENRQHHLNRQNHEERQVATLSPERGGRLFGFAHALPITTFRSARQNQNQRKLAEGQLKEAVQIGQRSGQVAAVHVDAPCENSTPMAVNHLAEGPRTDAQIHDVQHQRNAQSIDRRQYPESSEQRTLEARCAHSTLHDENVPQAKKYDRDGAQRCGDGKQTGKDVTSVHHQDESSEQVKR